MAASTSTKMMHNEGSTSCDETDRSHDGCFAEDWSVVTDSQSVAIPQRKTLLRDRSHPQYRYDVLTVLQAAPLAWKDHEGNLHTIETLDFDQEKEILSEALKDAKIVGGEVDIVFETATTDRLGAFLATSQSEVLHFSCHGHPEFLCFEDGSGGAQFLNVDDLRELMLLGGELRFVFVSACYSRSAGEAFVKAGVPHVVCCQQDEPLMDSASAVFSSNFYRALACGKTVKDAYRLGKQAVKLSPVVPDAENEMKKYLLLPEDANHNEAVFFTKIRDRLNGREGTHEAPPRILPHPPNAFIGREMDMYRLIQSLDVCRLVKLTGPPGIGKRSLAAALCRYITDRPRTFPFKDIIWIPMMHSSHVDELDVSLRLLQDILAKDNSTNRGLGDNNQYKHACGKIMEILYQRKALLIIDTKDLGEHLSDFLHDIFQGTKDVRVILICHPDSLTSPRSSWVESEMELEPLALESSVTLFGIVCPFVAKRRNSKIFSPRQLARFLVPEGQQELTVVSQRLSKRNEDLFEMIGEGVPGKIHDAARSINPADYDKLIEIGERKECNLVYGSRAQLELELSKLEEKIQNAIEAKNFLVAKEKKEEFDELERLREILPNLAELKRRSQSLQSNLEAAVSSKDFGKAFKLQEEYVLLESKINEEEKAQAKYQTDPNDSDLVSSEHSTFATRAELESRIKALELEMDRAAQVRDFAKAQEVHVSILELETQRKFLPSTTELSSSISALNNDLEAAIEAKDFVEAQFIHQRMQDLETKLDAELLESAHDGSCDNSQQEVSDFVFSSIFRQGYKRHISGSGLNPLTKTSIKPPTSGKKPFTLKLSSGSIVDFVYPPHPEKSAIVNSANEQCLSGGGADGAIGAAGGPELLRARASLPIVANTNFGNEVRCPTGEAKLTGPGSYGSLHVPFVIHAVGPNYFVTRSAEADVLLKSAYTKSLERAKDAKLEAIAFPLISSGLYRGRRSLKHVLRIGLGAIRDFGGYDELREVYMCAYSKEESNALVAAATDLGLVSGHKSSVPNSHRDQPPERATSETAKRSTQVLLSRRKGELARRHTSGKHP